MLKLLFPSYEQRHFIRFSCYILSESSTKIIVIPLKAIQKITISDSLRGFQFCKIAVSYQPSLSEVLKEKPPMERLVQQQKSNFIHPAHVLS